MQVAFTYLNIYALMKISRSLFLHYCITKSSYHLGKTVSLTQKYQLMAWARGSGHEPKNYFKGFQIGVYELVASSPSYMLFYLVEELLNEVNEPLAPILKVKIARGDDCSCARILGQKFFCDHDEERVRFYIEAANDSRKERLKA